MNLFCIHNVNCDQIFGNFLNITQKGAKRLVSALSIRMIPFVVLSSTRVCAKPFYIKLIKSDSKMTDFSILVVDLYGKTIVRIY